MAKSKVILRVDGNSNIGLGHIYRGIALAEMVRNDFDVSFVSRQDSTISPIAEAGFDYDILPEINLIDEPEWFKENINNNAIIVCDGYEFKAEYQKKIKEKGFKLVYIDDMVEYHMYADLVINHAPGIKESDYKAESYTKFALGLDYVLLRPAFLEAAKHKRQINKIDIAFVCFGGSDPNDFTYKTVKGLIKIDTIKKINVVVGSAYQHNKLIGGHSDKINIYKNLSEKEIFEIMKNSDLAIVPASTLLFELFAVNIFVISGYYVENQKGFYKYLVNNKMIHGIGNFNYYAFNELKDELKPFLSHERRINDIIDGKQKNRLLKLLKYI